MKKTMLILLIIVVLLIACQRQEVLPEMESQVMEATVVEVDQDQLLVEPVEGSPELSSADRIVAHTHEALVLDAEGEETTIENYEVGSLVMITYDGRVAESYPAQIWAEKTQAVK